MFYSLDNAFLWLTLYSRKLSRPIRCCRGSRVIAGAKEAPHPDKKNRVLLTYLKGVLRKNKGLSAVYIWDSLKHTTDMHRDP